MKEIKPIKVRGKLDPRRALFLTYYLDRDAETFSNAYQSAIKAGYEPSYAEIILTQDWVSDNLRYDRMVAKAEKVLEDCLEMPTEVASLVGKGENAEIMTVTDSSLIKIKQDTAKFVSERIGKFNEKSQLNVKSEGLSKIAEDIKKIANKMKNGK